MNPSQALIANRWLSVFFFIAIATLLSALVGWLVKKGALPLKPMMAFSSIQWQFMRVWVKVALVVGGILPLVMLVAFWDKSIPRQFFSCYLLAVAVQLACEASFSRLLCKSVVVIIGTFLYRVSDLAVVGRSGLIRLSDTLARFIVVSSAVLGG
jgi:hypothetical protein